MASPLIVLMSLWRNDASRSLFARADHLLSKTSTRANVRWLWAVGDSPDTTERNLKSVIRKNPDKDIELVRYDSGIRDVIDVTMRRRRSSWTASRMFTHLHDSDTYACLHESDLKSPDDVLDRMLDNPLPVAAWPMIRVNGSLQFYDIWAFRTLQGSLFNADMHHQMRIEVSSFGSVWMAPAELVRNRMLDDTAVVGLCTQWRNEGIRLYADPSIHVEQPIDLWESL